MSKKIRLMFAQHNELVRKSVIALLKTRPEFEITGEACNGKDLLEQLKQKETDIVLLELDMPVMDGRATLDVLQIRFPGIKVIMISSRENHLHATDLLARGASCYLSIDCGVESLFKAIDTVSREGYYFDNTTSKAMLGALINKQVQSQLKETVFNDRETEIMIAVCDGKTNKEIAHGLHLSISTIDFYKGRIYDKTNCNSAAGLLKYALKKGLVSLT